MGSALAPGAALARPLVIVAVALGALLAGACGSGDGASAGMSADGGAVVSDGGADAATAPPCSEPVASRPAGSACVRTVTGRLVEDDPTGAPIALLTTVCGAGLCLLAKGDASGFEVTVNRFVDLDASFVVHVDGRPSHANVFLRLARTSAEAVVLENAIRVPRLDSVGPALPAAPSGMASVLTAGEVTLTLAPGAAVELDFADAALEAEGRKLRAGRVSTEAAADPALVTLHALAPFGAVVKPAAGVAVALPAGSGLADGTAVDLVALDDTLDGPNIGRLIVVATGTVTAGVARSDPGAGLSRLTWIGVRRKSQ
jgi:hypothetical protein